MDGCHGLHPQVKAHQQGTVKRSVRATRRRKNTAFDALSFLVPRDALKFETMCKTGQRTNIALDHVSARRSLDAFIRT